MNATDVFVQSQNISIFIQTDKGTYKAGQTRMEHFEIELVILKTAIYSNNLLCPISRYIVLVFHFGYFTLA